MENIKEKLSKIYRNRFSEKELIEKQKLWKILIDDVLQKYIKANDSVADVGGGECLFINNIKCGKKYVIDLNPDTKRHANKDVIVINERADNISAIPDRDIEVVFVSNFLEHMRDKDELEKVIAEIKRILVLNGLLLIIQPNIRYAYKEYWDFHDHYIPISDKSLAELLRIKKFQIKACYPKFLPYTTKSRFSRFSLLLKIYLRTPFLWRIVGKQLFIVAQNLSDTLLPVKENHE